MSSRNARNSRLRNNTRGPIEKVAGYLTDKFPKLKANQISWIGFTSVLGGSSLQAYSKIGEQDAIAGLLQATGSLVDAFDGPVARLGRGSENGFLHDVSADKLSEAAIFWGHALAAKKRGSKLGELAALAALSTCVLPALVRSGAETIGYVTEEDGGSRLSLLGTRAGRCVLGVLGTISPEIQPLSDTISSVSNVYASFSRIKTMKKNKDLESDLKNVGIKKLPILASLFVLTSTLSVKLKLMAE